MDEGLGKHLREFLKVQRRYEQIMQNENLDYETKQRQAANLQLEGGKGRIEDLALYFTMIGATR